MKLWQYIAITIMFICIAFVGKYQYWAGYEYGVKRTEQCLINGGTIKADYEEHFICMY